MDVEELAAAVRGVNRRVGLELQWDLSDEDEPPFGYARWMLALHVIVARPGPDHSRYSTIALAQLEADQPEQRRDAHRIAAAVAAATALPLHAPPLEDRGGQGDSTWIRSLPAGPPHPYELTWEVRWWTNDGAPATASGAEHVTATSGHDADILLRRELRRRFSGLPLWLKIRGSGERYEGFGSEVGAAWPSLLPDLERVRAIALTEGCRAAGVARGLVARVPALTPLELMIAFSEAFEIRFEDLAPLASWRKGALGDAELDAALPHVADHRHRWDRVRRLRDAQAAGQSVAAMLREERGPAGVVRLVRDLRFAFDISLGEAKELVDSCRDPRDDAQLDAQLARAARSKR